jgi:hypothetical protein
VVCVSKTKQIIQFKLHQQKVGATGIGINWSCRNWIVPNRVQNVCVCCNANKSSSFALSTLICVCVSRRMNLFKCVRTYKHVALDYSTKKNVFCNWNRSPHSQFQIYTHHNSDIQFNQPVIVQEPNQGHAILFTTSMHEGKHDINTNKNRNERGPPVYNK